MAGALLGFWVIGVIIGIGYITARSRVLGDEANDLVGRLLFFVLSPFVLFDALSNADIRLLFSTLLPILAIATVLAFGTYIAYILIFKKQNLGQIVIGALGSGYTNSANIGIPIALYLLGDASLSAPIILLQFVFIQPIALALLEVHHYGTVNVWQLTLRMIRNPMVLGSVLGCIVGAIDLELPVMIKDPIHMLALAGVPIMLFNYGLSLFGERMLAAGSARDNVAVASIIKILAMPLFAYLVALWIGFSGKELLIVVVLAALPTAQNVYNYAQRYDVGQILARDIIFVSTLGSVPVILGIAALLS